LDTAKRRWLAIRGRKFAGRIATVGVFVVVIVGRMIGGGFRDVAAEDAIIPVLYPAHYVAVDTFVAK